MVEERNPFLVVIENLFFSSRVAQLLAEMGARPAIGRNPAEALNRAREMQPNVVILDLKTRKVDLPGLIQEIRQAVPEDLMLLGYTPEIGPEETKRAEELGIDRLVPNDEIGEVLAEIVPVILGRHRPQIDPDSELDLPELSGSAPEMQS